jgi:hypothetical protein
MDLQRITEAPPQVSGAIANASRATGADFDYLLKTALQESNFDAGAKASGSSATGLFQFVDQTWLATLKQAGPALGYGPYANAIVASSSGQYSVPDPAARRAVMSLRLDPVANAAMAGALTRSNAAGLRTAIGREPTEGDLYVAHVLGASGAAKLIRAAASAPGTDAVSMFPNAARANPAIFYGGQGARRTAAQVYSTLISSQSKASAAAVTAAAPSAPATATQPAAAVDDASSDLTTAADLPHYHSLFQTAGPGAISPVATQLWGADAAAGTVPGRAEPDAAAPGAMAAQRTTATPASAGSQASPGPFGFLRR